MLLPCWSWIMFQSLCSATTSRSSLPWSTRLQTAWNSCLFVTYATHSLQFLLCFDNECLLLDFKLHIINSVVIFFFFCSFTCKNILWSPKRSYNNEFWVLPLTYQRILARTRIVLEDYNMSCDDVSIFFLS